MIVHRQFDQKSGDWLQARAGILTASEFDQIVKSNFQPRTGQMPQTYLAIKTAERWLGGPLPAFNQFFDMEQGQILEDEALNFISLQLNHPIERVGLITTDDGQLGCSPDGLLPDGTGLEIKCPSIAIHCGYLLAGKLPKAYAPQVHGAMLVTGAPRWHFLSYRRRFPPLFLTIERDEKIQAKLAAALAAFQSRLTAASERLRLLDLGPPASRRPVENSLKPRTIK